MIGDGDSAGDELSPRGMHLEALGEIHRLTAVGLDEEAAARHFTDSVARLVRSPYARLWLLDPGDQALVLVSASGALAPLGDIGLRSPANLRTLDRDVLAGGQVYQTSDVAADPRWLDPPIVEARDLRAYLGVPLLLGDRRIGIVSLLFSERREFLPDELLLIETIAAHAAVVLANARAYGASRQLSERLATLAEISRLVTESLNAEAVSQAATEAVARLLEIDDVQLWLYDGAADVLRMAAWMLAGRGPGDHVAPLDDGPLGRVLRSGQPLSIDRETGQALWNGVVPRQDGFESGLIVPFFDQQGPQGVLVALSTRLRTFDEADVRLAQTLGAQISIALRNARSYDDARRQTRRLATILDVNERLALGPDLGEILSRITEEAARLLDVEAAGLRLVEGDQLVRAATFGAAGMIMIRERIPIGESLSGRVAAERRPIVSVDLAADPRYDPVHRAEARFHEFRSWLGVPLAAREGVLGVLFVVSKARRLGPAEVGLLEAFANQAAIAVENARLLATTERRAAEAMAVAEVGRAITGSLDPQSVLDLIVDHAARLLGTQRAGVAIAEPEGSEYVYRFVARKGLSDDFPERMRPRSPTDGTTARAIAERRPVWSPDILNDPSISLTPHIRAAAEAEGYRAVLSVPLLINGHVLGALVVYQEEVGPFSSGEVALLQVFADQAAIAIQNARSFASEHERRRQLEAVREVTAELTRELDLGKLLDLIIRRAADLVHAPSALVQLWDAQAAELVPEAWHGLEDWVRTVTVRLGEGAAGQAAAQRTGVIVNDYRDLPRAHPLVLRHTRISAVLAEPIVYQDRLIGVITVHRHAGDPAFAERDRGLLNLFAGQAAIAIENARLFEAAAAAEALREVSRLRTELLQTVSHELRTPLSIVYGYAELLMHRAPQLGPEQVTEMAGEIHAAARTMARLADDLLGASEMELETFQLRTRRVDISALLQRLVHAFRVRPGGERIRAEIDSGLQAPADPERLTQIASNLLDNALNYAPEAPIVVRARRGNGSIMVEVNDRGPGIPREEQARVWEKLFRGSREISSRRRGSGLGLAIVRQLVHLHGGQVGLKSTPGRGATFWFTLPTSGDG